MESLPEYESNRQLVIWILWIIWILSKSGNEYIFNRRNVHPIEDLRRAVDANLELHRNVILNTSMNRSLPVNSSKWEPPPVDWVKCNFDYSSSAGNNSGCIGWILRDENGKFLGAGSVQVQKMQTSFEGEAFGFLLALQKIWIRGWRRVWFEGDNQELCTIIINQVKDHLDLGNLLTDIRHWMQLLPESSLDYVNREMNQAADALTKQAVQQNSSSLYYHVPHVWWLISCIYLLRFSLIKFVWLKKKFANPLQTDIHSQTGIQLYYYLLHLNCFHNNCVVENKLINRPFCVGKPKFWKLRTLNSHGI